MGVLYIIGTVAGILNMVITNPILNVPDYLSKIAAYENQFVLGVLLVLTMGLALAMVRVMIFPILRKQDEAPALGYVVFREALETVTYFALGINWPFLLIVSKEYVQVGAAAGSYLQIPGTSFPEATAWINQTVTIVFILGALMFYFLLYRSKLFPRCISGWCLIAAIPYLAAGFLVLFGLVYDS